MAPLKFGAAQLRALHDAVMRERVVHDQVAGTEQRADHGHIGRVVADEHDAIVDLVERRERRFEFALHGPLARHHAARGRRRAIAVDRLFRPRTYVRIAGEAEIVVVRVVQILGAADARRRAGHALMHAKKR
ncbi:hypothetical protein HDG33_006322 [Paraburkholderia sp. Cpub6]|nr:hypothetical protein [Paraburkholderia sp. Cpub6]